MKKEKKKEWRIDVKTPCERRGIKNAYQLWQKIGGSKDTTAQLFSGNTQMIRVDTINKLYAILGILPMEIFATEEIE